MQDIRTNITTKRDENGEWERLHNEELHSLFRSPNIKGISFRRFQLAEHVARMNKGKSLFKTLTSKSIGNWTLERPRHIWENDVRMGH